MKAISLKQPWANYILNGLKSIETRKWKTHYRGDLLICSSQNPKIEPYGQALCIVEVYGCRPMEKNDEERACCKIYPKAQSWMLRNLRIIEPTFPVKGKLSFFNVKLPQNTVITPVKFKSEF